MKKNDWILLISTLTYSYLFYEEAAGLNFLIFNLVLIGCLFIKNKDSVKNKSWLTAAIGSVISSACIMYYSSPLAILTNIFSLALLSVFSFAPGTSVFTSLFLTAASIGTAPVMMFIDWVQRSKNSQQKSSRSFVGVIMTILVLLIVVLFFFMYQSSNPLFKDFTKDINLDFISWGWIFFTLGGFLLLYGFYYYKRLSSISDFDTGLSNILEQNSDPEKGFINRILKQDIEFISGMVLFGILNLMLLIVNVLDLNYLWFDGKLPEGIQHKEFVHDGVGVLITSLICAILILLFYFRGRLNFFSKNKFLKLLAYAWIIQNMFMIFSNAYRNNMYIEEAGISYKKIGVYVYLGLTLIGLITTYIKVARLKSNMFLFRVNPWCYYVILVLSCLFNWDVYITNFNINKALTQNKKLEKYYLVDLSFKNLPQLLVLNDSIKNYDDYDARDYYYSLRGTYFTSFKSALDIKLYSFLKETQDLNWKSYCSEKNRVRQELADLNEKKLIKRLDLSGNTIYNSLEPIKSLNNLENLSLNNDYFDKLGDLSAFPHLKTLSLLTNKIDSLDKLPLLNDLIDLQMSGNSISILSGLKNAPNLQTLDVSSNRITDLSSLPSLKKLSHLNLSTNNITDFSALAKCDNLEHLSLGSTFHGKLDSFPTLPHLTQLDLYGNALSEFTADQFMRSFGLCKNIKYLDLSDNNLSFLDYIIPSSRNSDLSQNLLFEELEVLQLSNNKLTYTTGIEKWKNLKELYLSSNLITNISGLFSLTQLKTLKIDYNRINSIEGIETLDKLETLSLSGCGIRNGFKSLAKLNNLTSLYATDNALASLTPLLNNKKLQTLNLSGNNLRDIKGIEQLSDLEYLYIDRNGITDLTPLYQLKKLKNLNIDNVSEAVLAKLKKELPNCTITTAQRD